ncbi:MAG: glycosyltransferase [Candidatus Aegiribacteria sp.]|nr:glycosyltransferase [Candidatus Aegiribacteria sp.]MBD3295069.1 glycosyltransferase [Candidatus Fermentibacteria bacterium]
MNGKHSMLCWWMSSRALHTWIRSGRKDEGMKRVRVFYDMSVVAHAAGGVARYTLSIAEALEQVSEDEGIRFEKVDVPAVHPGIDVPVSCRKLETPFYLSIPFLRRIPVRGEWEEKSRSKRLGRLTGGPCVYHHSGVQPAYPPNCTSVVTFFDLSALEHPQWHTDDTIRYAERKERLVRNGSFVTTISEWSRRRISERFQLKDDQVFCAGGAADDHFSSGEPSVEVLRKYEVEKDRYFLHVGNYVPRKNIPFLLDVYGEYRKSERPVPLIMTGAGSWGGVEIDEADGIRVFRSIPDRDLLHLYRGTRALLCPSRYEGLGLPVLEAFACGAPVISSNATALNETVGSGGVKLSPDDTGSWVREMISLKDPEKLLRLKALSAGMPRVRWKDVASRLCSFYRKVAAE